MLFPYRYSEIIRAIDSLQLTDRNKVATPADWKVLVLESLSGEFVKLFHLFQYSLANNAWFCPACRPLKSTLCFQTASPWLSCPPGNHIFVKRNVRSEQRLAFIRIYSTNSKTNILNTHN